MQSIYNICIFILKCSAGPQGEAENKSLKTGKN